MKAFNCLLPQAWRTNRAKSLGRNSSEASEDTDRSSANPLYEETQHPTVGQTVPVYQNCNGSDELARWRMRVNARRSIYDRLAEIGTFACLACGSMLLYPTRGGSVPRLSSASRWKEVFYESELFKALSPNRILYVKNMQFEHYNRLEQAIISFGSMIVLSVEDMEDSKLIAAFARFKLWAVENGSNPEKLDGVIATIKWLGKLCLSTLLGIPSDQAPPGYLDIVGEVLTPFDGPLRFISDLYLRKRERSDGLQLEEARKLAQIASVSRALPYPSAEQVNASVRTSVETFTQSEKVDKRTLRDYTQRGLNPIRESLPPIGDTRTHISIARSASLESTRSEGGRGHYVISRVKPVADQPLTREFATFLVGRKDVYGNVILDATIAARVLDGTYTRQFRFGDMAYKKASEALLPVSDEVERAPPKLGHLIMLQSSFDMLDFGTYDRPYLVDFQVLTFHDSVGRVKFVPKVERVPVRAGLSIEAGMKTRLTTAAPAAATQIGQAISNKMREYLSQDPFMRVGFDEADKLWEVLKAYSNRQAKEKLAKLRQELDAKRGLNQEVANEL